MCGPWTRFFNFGRLGKTQNRRGLPELERKHMSIASFGNRTGMKRKAGALVLTAAALAFSSLSQPARAQDESGLRAPIEGLRAPIEGTWILQVHRRSGVWLPGVERY